MEGIEMTTGVSTAVSQTTDLGGQVVNGEVSEVTETRSLNVTENIEPVNLPSSPSLGGEESEQFQGEFETNNDSADAILNSAKEEGFEEALIHLANGDFDGEIESLKTDDNPDSEEVSLGEPEAEDVNNPKPEKIQDTDTKTKPENEDAEPSEDEERQAVVEKIRFLEEKLDSLEEKNKELSARLMAVENRQALTMQTLLEMAMVLREMVKDEEDEEKKVSLLELLVDMMGNLMIAMFVPDDKEANKKVSQLAQKEQKQVKKGTKKRSLEEIVRTLRDRGEIRSQVQINTGTPEPQATELPMAA